MTVLLSPGAVVLADFQTGTGGEQQGRRPAVVVSSFDYLELIDGKVIVVPCTTRDRGWPNHPILRGSTGLPSATFAMTEQVRMLDRQRVLRATGMVDGRTLMDIRSWLRQWIL